MSKGIWKNIRLILFLTATLGILVFLYLVVNQVDFRGGLSYQIQFDYIGTINIGSPVRKSGVKVGSVKQIEINQEDRKTVYVTVLLDQDQPVRQEDRFAIVSGGILGDQFIEIFPGNQDVPLVDADTIIIGEKALDLNGLAVEGGTMLKELSSASKVLNRLLTENETSLGTIIQNLETITTDLTVFSRSTRELGATIPLLTREFEEAADRIGESIADFSLQGSEILSAVQKQITGNQDNLKATVDNLSIISAELLNLTQSLSAEGSVLNLLGDAEVSDNLKTSVENLREVTDDVRQITEELFGTE